jgi:Cu/Ag efflux protein CusF
MNIKLFSALLLLTGGLDVMNPAVAGKADLVGTAVVNDMRIEFYMEAPKHGMVMTSGRGMTMDGGLPTHHPEVKVFDVESGKFIPYLDVVLHFKNVASGQVHMLTLPPMLGSWFHYGRNGALPGEGKYEVQVIVTPQDLMRYKRMAEKWAEPAIAVFAYEWKGEIATEGIFEGRGKVIALVPEKSQLVLEHEEIKGFMRAMPMGMGYAVESAELLRGLNPGDPIKFKVDAANKKIIAAERLK